MSDERYELEYESASFSHLVSSLIADRLEEFHPLDLAQALERHAHRMRAEGGSDPRFTIEMRDSDRLSVAVYDETGGEHLFQDQERAIEFIKDEFQRESDE